MIKVYFETENKNYSELVAVFATEEFYQLCLPHLEVQASLTDLIVTMSIEEEDLSDRF